MFVNACWSIIIIEYLEKRILIQLILRLEGSLSKLIQIFNIIFLHIGISSLRTDMTELKRTRSLFKLSLRCNLIK